MDLTCLLWAEACRCKSDVSPPEGMRSPTDQAQHCPPHHQPRGDHLQGEEEFLINKYASNPSQERTGYTSFAPTEATKPPAARGGRCSHSSRLFSYRESSCMHSVPHQELGLTMLSAELGP